MSNNIAVQRRAANIRMLLNRFASQEMTRFDIQDALQMSGSGMRKYLNELLSSGLIAVSRTEDVPYRHPRSQVRFIEYYALTSDAAKIAAYLLALDRLKWSDVTKPKSKPVSSDPSRHFHFAGDDISYAHVIPKWKIPEPHDVLAHFFGRVSA